ncbi:hypothetical protein TELCIR_17052 [Teladorsagia circumcincta]|uniref:Uncharacterized protein n=1 Tax=Teladorsagia circumcincta TaxID=45464 RepID=A0A2G9TU30_TELCI|nr:hypothetical protein TELCIR_17052 [Teladorsagia circumcincta]
MDWLTGSSRNIFEQADTYLNVRSTLFCRFCCQPC